MDILIVLLTPLEMLIVNLVIIDNCSIRRYSRLKTILMMTGFAVVLIALSYFISSLLPGFGRGSGLFIFCGFLFAFPIKFLYKNSMAKIICLACTSWVYTFFLFSISVHISNLFPGFEQSRAVLAIQTVLYLITLAWFFKELKNKILYLLAQLTHKETLNLMWMSILWFFAAFIINLAFLHPEIYILRIIAIITVALCALNFYRYIYRFIASHREMETLEQIAYQDDITQLRSRVVLENDAKDMIEREIPFYLIFIDLDYFKTINDTYGHVVGDTYLAFFAHEVKIRLKSRGGFYRVAGDEFVCLYADMDVDSFLKEIDALPEMLPENEIEFKGASYGAAKYPEDGEDLQTLMDAADVRMYAMKKRKHRESNYTR